MSIVRIENLEKSFRHKRVLKGIDLDFHNPGITTILGPNASGKTTLIKTVLGMVFPDKGAVSIDGENILGKSEYKSRINYLPQHAQFPENLHVHELIEFIADIKGRDNKSGDLLDAFGIRPYLNEKISVLSGGTRQKLNIVLAFMYDNILLILDEPTNGLDPVAQVRLKELLRSERDKGKYIIVTTHIMQLVEELSDRIIYMLEGRIHFDGGIGELKEKYKASSVELCIAKLLATGKPDLIKNREPS